ACRLHPRLATRPQHLRAPRRHKRHLGLVRRVAHFANGRAQSYYPGNAYVDWIAGDGWSFWPVQQTPKGRWRSLQEIFSSMYSWGSTMGKPLMIAATGVQEDPSQPTRKAQWFADAPAWLKTV